MSYDDIDLSSTHSSSTQAVSSRIDPSSRHTPFSTHTHNGAGAVPKHHGLGHRLKQQRKKEESYLESDGYLPYTYPESTNTRDHRDTRTMPEQHAFGPKSEGHRKEDGSYFQPDVYPQPDGHLPYTSQERSHATRRQADINVSTFSESYQCESHMSSHATHSRPNRRQAPNRPMSQFFSSAEAGIRVFKGWIGTHNQKQTSHFF